MFYVLLAAASAASQPMPPSTAPASAPETVARQIERRIDEEMVYPAQRRGRRETGFVHVIFELDPEGMPTSIGLAKRARSSVLNKSAIDTIGRIGPIVGGIVGMKYYAVLQYDVASGMSVDAKAQELEREANRAALGIVAS